jgi:radical SAM superfamily enzyme YgiQ (UPF0313 family)
MPNILLINPWIYDFAAYNLWIRPMGLLYIGGFLKKAGYNVSLIDCLESNDKKKLYGCGNYHKEKVEKPEAIKDFPRKYNRYGMPLDTFIERINNAPRPDAVLVTSIMTYWYPGVQKVVDIIKDKFNNTPVLMGGIYVSLNWEHATKCFGSDVILIKGEGEHASLNKLNEILAFKSNINIGMHDYNMYPAPLSEAYDDKEYCGMLTSRGCPFNCSYCASKKLNNGFRMRSPLNVVDEMEHLIKEIGYKNMAFFDDALLHNPREHIIPILDEIIRRKLHCNFHLPNGIFARQVDTEVAQKMFRAGFRTIRLGFESSSDERQKESSRKVNNDDIRQALQNLYQAGYTTKEVGAYILMGLPHQPMEEVVESLLFAWQTGARPILASYAIIPDTPYYEDTKKELGLTGEMDPLLHNNSLFPLWREKYGWEAIHQVKMLARLVATAQDFHLNFLDQSILGHSVRQALRKLTGT